MGRAIPPEWTVIFLALGKEPWRLKDLEDQLNMYRQQWQADQQKQIIAQMAGKMPSKSNERKRKSNDRNHHNSNGGRSSTRQDKTSRGRCGGRGRGRGGRGNNSDHLKMWNVSIAAKRVIILLTDHSQERMTMNSQTWSPKKVFKNIFQSSLKDMLTKTDKQAKKKESTEGDDDSLDMNVFEKLMEGKHTKNVKKSNDDLQSINDTDTFDFSMQDKITHTNCEHNNYNNDYDELAHPFSKIIKLKHEPEKAQEKVYVQYTADTILEIKKRDGTVVPMRALLDTGARATMILREFVGKGRASTNTKKRTKWKTLGGTF
jgi:hypothetical protein